MPMLELLLLTYLYCYDWFQVFLREDSHKVGETPIAHDHLRIVFQLMRSAALPTFSRLIGCS